MHSRRTLLAAFLALATVRAHSQTGAASIGSSFVKPAPGALLLLLPASAEGDELSPGLPLLLDALHAELTGAGYRTGLLDAQNHATIWAQEVDAVGGIFDARSGAPKPAAQAAAMSALAQRLARETKAALVIQPKLVFRKAELHGTKAAWDGRVVFAPTRGTDGGSSRQRGTTPAISVQLLAFTDTGALAFNTFGGVKLPYVVDFVTERPVLRSDLFPRADEDLAQGAKLALKPVLNPG
jgi:hypothetical protein